MRFCARSEFAVVGQKEKVLRPIEQHGVTSSVLLLEPVIVPIIVVLKSSVHCLADRNKGREKEGETTWAMNISRSRPGEQGERFHKIGVISNGDGN